MTDLEGGVVILKQKQTVWRKYSQEEVFQVDWFCLKGLTILLLNSGPLKGTFLPSSLYTQKDLIEGVERVRG